MPDISIHTATRMLANDAHPMESVMKPALMMHAIPPIPVIPTILFSSILTNQDFGLVVVASITRPAALMQERHIVRGFPLANCFPHMWHVRFWLWFGCLALYSAASLVSSSFHPSMMLVQVDRVDTFHDELAVFVLDGRGLVRIEMFLAAEVAPSADIEFDFLSVCLELDHGIGL